MPIISVSQLNNYMKRYVEQNVHLSDLWIKGEISNFKKHYSGHVYFSLKDATSVLKAVMFKSQAQNLTFDLNDGMKVIVYGKLGVYERDGVYQLYIESVIPDGIGELYATYEKLKNKLNSEGLFAPEYKKNIPVYPQKIGIVTSSAGAALRDILNVINRRYKLAKVCVYHAKVQGIGSADSICEGLNFFSCDSDCDVVILSRGGGSIEDLWAFNEEKTARAIFSCSKPVVTGIGHETDYTIADFVADMRAPTPSAAAEICTPDINEMKEKVYQFSVSLDKCVNYMISNYSSKMERFSSDNLDFLIQSLFERKEYRLNMLKIMLINQFNDKYSAVINKLNSLSESLDLLDPRRVLERGYSMVQNLDDSLLSIDDLKVNTKAKIIMNKGCAICQILEVNHE